MAVTIVKYQPELTPARLREIFAAKFPQYNVTSAVAIVNTDFVVQKSGWTGVGVKLRQRDSETAVLTKAVVPGLFPRLLTTGLIGFIPYMFFGGYRGALNIEREALEYIKTSPEFQ